MQGLAAPPRGRGAPGKPRGPGGAAAEPAGVCWGWSSPWTLHSEAPQETGSPRMDSARWWPAGTRGHGCGPPSSRGSWGQTGQGVRKPPPRAASSEAAAAVLVGTGCPGLRLEPLPAFPGGFPAQAGGKHCKCPRGGGRQVRTQTLAGSLFPQGEGCACADRQALLCPRPMPPDPVSRTHLQGQAATLPDREGPRPGQPGPDRPTG